MVHNTFYTERFPSEDLTCAFDSQQGSKLSFTHHVQIACGQSSTRGPCWISKLTTRFHVLSMLRMCGILCPHPLCTLLVLLDMVADTLEELGLDPIMEVLENVSLPVQIPSTKTARGWDIATTLARAQRVISLDLLVQLSPDVDSADNGKIILNVSTARAAVP